MKTKIMVLFVAITISFGARSFAQDRTYKDGTVWAISLIKVNPGQGIDYLNSLKDTWKKVQDEAVKQGLILSYKMLSGMASTPDDWNVLLMVEYKDLASMDGNEDKWEAIQNKISTVEVRKKLMESRVSVRTMYGNKLMREVIYK
jgi:hypothetical protein